MYTMTQTQRIAEAGARKMNGAGYTYEAARTPGLYWVKKATGEKYLTSAVGTYCDCPFGQENGLRKHSLWLAEQLADEARWQEQAEGMDAVRYELEDAKY